MSRVRIASSDLPAEFLCTDYVSAAARASHPAPRRESPQGLRPPALLDSFASDLVAGDYALTDVFLGEVRVKEER